LVNCSFAKRSCPCANGRLVSGDQTSLMLFVFL
jgi:hypothetical protein